MKNHSHLFIFEPNTGGHHPVWLQYIVEDFLYAGYRLTLGVDLLKMKPFFEKTAPHLVDRVIWVDVLNDKRHWRNTNVLKTLAHMDGEIGADHIFLPNLDVMMSDISRWAAVGSFPPQCLKGRLSGVYHRPMPLDVEQKGLTNLWKRIGLRRLLTEGWFKNIYFVDEFLADAVTHLFSGANYYTLPDPWDGDFSIYDRLSARQALGIPEQAVVWLHYGVGAKRKGLSFVLNAFNRLLIEDRPFLLIAGQLKPDAELEGLLSHWVSHHKAYVLNRYVSDLEEKQCFAACDGVLLPYLSHYGSANVLSRAAAAKRPVIASDFHLLGQRVRYYGLGYVFENENQNDFISVYQKTSCGKPNQKQDFQLGLVRYAQITCREHFRDSLLQGIYA